MKIRIVPPHQYKEQVVKEYGRSHDLHILVETGTLRGKMVEAMTPYFHYIFSIELDPKLFTKAFEKFSSNPNIRICQGDSGSVLPTLSPFLEEPVLFWLDAHYSGGITAKGEKTTPIREELECILQRPYRDVILIDDFHQFKSDSEFPSMNDLIELVETTLTVSNQPKRQLEVEQNIIRITPNMVM